MLCSNTGDQAGKDLCEVGAEPNSSSGDLCGDYYVKLSTLQRGVLRTNCIDCLDRTNVAQYAYGLVALGHQLHALGFIDVENIDLDSALADNLMKLYEAMGDTLALQYGGSAAHNKVILPCLFTQNSAIYFSSLLMDTGYSSNKLVVSKDL